MPTNVRDPRTLITPDAFEISPDLLGTPLARPWRRFWALMIDLVVIGILTLMLEGVIVFVFGMVAVVLIVASFRTRFGSGQAVSILLRTATGCLGLTILGIIAVVVMVNGFTGPDGTPDLPMSPGSVERALELAGVDEAALAGVAMTGGERLGDAATAEEAEAVALALLRDMEDVEMSDEARLEFLARLTPDDAPWEEEADEIYLAALSGWRAERRSMAPADTTGAGTVDVADTAEAADATDPAGAGAAADEPDRGEERGPASGDEQGAEAEVAVLEDAEVLRQYAALLEEGPVDDADPRARALRRRAAGLVAQDTMAALRNRILAAHDSVESERRRRGIAEAELEEGGNAFAELLRDIWEQLGSAIGLWSLYFTVLLTVWRGQTVGKRLLGLRVLRLDGLPINWWSAFERAGGYIAGLATGLLGFAQVFWDPNRQCIHDKIVGTVVIDARGARVHGAWQEAWTGSEEESG